MLAQILRLGAHRWTHPYCDNVIYIQQYRGIMIDPHSILARRVHRSHSVTDSVTEISVAELSALLMRTMPTCTVSPL